MTALDLTTAILAVNVFGTLALGFLNYRATQKAQSQNRETQKQVVQVSRAVQNTQEAVEEVHRSTNGKMEKLLEVVGNAREAEGVLKGKEAAAASNPVSK